MGSTVKLETQDLLRLVKDDNQRAFDSFYHLYYSQVFRFAYFLLKDTNACQEVVSNVFFSVWKSRKSLAEIQNIETYLYVITRNEASRYQREETIRETVSLDHFPLQTEKTDMENPEEELIRQEVEELINRIVENLPEKCRLIFLMSRIEGLKNKEIAERLSLSESTVRVQMKIAIEKIVEQMKIYYPHLSLVGLLTFFYDKEFLFSVRKVKY
ncbi:MAG: RNA polymerase sigma-70 factor [Bacteroides sp.]|nr:RNA polymerase sigma-70 factor [Bacteroides sp.]